MKDGLKARSFYCSGRVLRFGKPVSRPLWLAGFGLWVVLGFAQPARAADDVSVEQVQAAFKMAHTAIVDEGSTYDKESIQKLHRISTDAVARSLQFGPPMRSEEERSDPLIFRSVVVDINRRIPESRVGTFRRELPGLLLELSRKWDQHNVQPADVFRTLQICVNPPVRPDRLFLYPLEDFSSSFPSPLDSASAAHELIFWARKSGQLQQLKQSLSEQQLDAMAEGCFLFLLIAMEQDDEAAISNYCTRLTAFVQNATDPRLARLLAASILKAKPELLTRDAVVSLLLSTGQTLLAVDQQSDGQHSFAATVAVAGLRYRISHAFKKGTKGAQIVSLADRLVSLKVLPEPLRSEFRAAVADEVLLAGWDQLPMTETLADIVAERRLRFRDRTSDQPRPPKTAEAPSDLRIEWQPGQSPSSDSIWFQAAGLTPNDESPGNLFTISGLVDVGSPSSSRDGSIIAFHGRRTESVPGSGNHLFVVDRKLKTLRDLGPGVNPSVSPNGRRFTFSRYTPSKGIWLARVDGTNVQRLSPTGWASRFNSDGTLIGWTIVQGNSTQFQIYDLTTRRQVFLPPNPANPMLARSTTAVVAGWPFCWDDDHQAPVGSGEFETPGQQKGFWAVGQDQQTLVLKTFDRQTPGNIRAGHERRLPTTFSRDLHRLTTDTFVWLGPGIKNSSELGMWSSHANEAIMVKGRQVRGLCPLVDRQVLLISREIN